MEAGDMSVHWTNEHDELGVIGHDGDRIHVRFVLNQWIGREQFEKELNASLEHLRSQTMIEYDKLVAMDTPA